MAISPYFKHVSAKNEQKLIDDLTRETIFQRGLDLYYIPRTDSDEGFDYLFGEDPENSFDSSIELEFWCENVEGWDGSLSIGRFALEMPETAIFQVSKTRFEEEVTRRHKDITRPREGDLLIFKTDPEEPIHVFEITYSDEENPFYQIGKPHVYRFEVERFNYSHENMETGIEELDISLSHNDAEDHYEENEPIQTESDTFLNFDEDDPFSDGEY